MRVLPRLVPVVAAGGLAAAVVAGLGAGHGALVAIRPASGAGAGGLSGLQGRQGGEATTGAPRFGQLPPERPAAATPAAARGPAPSLIELVATSGVQGIPAVALAAYERAAGILAQRDATCGITWQDLAGIGRVESDNGMTWGSSARVTPAGTLSPPILGPVLDGQDGMPAMPTPDHGVLEHDAVWERAVGPMQFLPSTWVAYAQDGNGDGAADPQNFYDAALTAGTYLCANGGDLAMPSGLTDAIYAYNHSASYVATVEAWIAYYRGVGPQALLAAGAGMLATGVAAPVGGNGAPAAGGTAQPPQHSGTGSHAPTTRPPAHRRRKPAPTTSTTSTTTTTTLLPGVTLPPVTLPTLPQVTLTTLGSLLGG